MKLFHPTIPGHTVDVPDSTAAQWAEQGWRKTEPKPAAQAAPADDPKKG